MLAIPLSLSLLATACGDDDDDTGTGGGGGGGSAASAAPECLSLADLYALVGPESEGFGNWSDAQDLAAELGSDTEFPDATLDLTGPGQESGTYDSFVELALEGFAEEREQDATTRTDYDANADDNIIIQNVESSDTSLGWVGWAFAKEQGENVANIPISAEPGGECVAVSDETIADFSYPLSRPLFIYVNVGKAQENPALAAFTDFYLADLGTWVAEGGYVPLPDDTAAETTAAWEGAGVTGGEGGEALNISGSSTVEPITAIVAEEFFNETGIDVTVDGPGTGDGFELFCNGETDISDASRAIEDDEVAACEEAGVEYVELLVGYDGMAVMTNPNFVG
jgi:ABC-type phosphate transport system substrate-binding protein